MFDDFTLEIQSDELAAMIPFFEEDFDEILEDDDYDFNPDEDEIYNYTHGSFL